MGMRQVPWRCWALALEMVDVAQYNQEAYVRQLWDVYLRQGWDACRAGLGAGAPREHAASACLAEALQRVEALGGVLEAGAPAFPAPHVALRLEQARPPACMACMGRRGGARTGAPFRGRRAGLPGGRRSRSRGDAVQQTPNLKLTPIRVLSCLWQVAAGLRLERCAGGRMRAGQAAASMWKAA